MEGIKVPRIRCTFGRLYTGAEIPGNFFASRVFSSLSRSAVDPDGKCKTLRRPATASPGS
jgi:hypothetical protein